MPEKDTEKQTSEATEKSNSESAETVGKTSPDTGKTDDGVDVSDEGLKAEYAKYKVNIESSNEKVADESVNEGDAKDTKTQNGQVSDEGEGVQGNAEDALNDVAQTILDSLPKQKADENKSADVPVENRLKEYERKNKDLYEELQAFKSGKQPQEKQQPEQSQMSKDEFTDMLSERYGWTRSKAEKNWQFMNDFYQDVVIPKLNGMENTLKKNEMKGKLQSDKMYVKFEKEINDVLKNDPIAKQIQDDAARIEYAKLKVKDNHLPEVVESIRKGTTRQVKQNRKVITPTPLSNPSASKKTSVKGLTEADRSIMAQFDLTEEDVKRLGGKKLTLD